MEKAKAAASNFLSLDGKHKTSVDQDVRGAVTEEHVRPHHHENVTTAVDKEVHQHHHQTRIQPVKHQEILPETSTHVMNPVEHREFHHDDENELRSRLQQDAAAYKDTSTTHETTHSTADAPVVAGEHVHHHVHEHIQPVIQKETHARHVIHKTAPIHETHHAQPIHHEATTLPVKTLDEFKSSHGGMEGKTASALREFEGCPGPYNKERNLPSTALHPESPTESGMGYSTSSASRSGLTGGGMTGSGMTGSGMAGSGMTGSGIGATEGTTGMTEGTSGTRSGLRSSDRKVGMADTMDGSNSPEGNYTFSGDKRTTGMAGAGAAGAGAGVAGAGSGLGTTGATSSSMKDTMPRSEETTGTSSAAGSTGRRKTSLMDRVQDKLNPKVDSDGDGKKGILS